MTDAGHGVPQKKQRSAPEEADAGDRPHSAVLARLGVTAFAAMLAEAATFPIGAPRAPLCAEQQQQAVTLTGCENRHDEDTHAAGGASPLPVFSACHEACTLTCTSAQRSSGVPSQGALATLAGVLRSQGVRGVYRGVAPAMLRHVAYSPTRILVYESLRQTASSQNVGDSVTAKLAFGAIAGSIGQLVAVPADLVKVRMQADATSAAPRYRGVSHAFAVVAKEDGLRGLWRGTLPAVQRAALVNLGELATYDVAKVYSVEVLGEGSVAHGVAALASGLVATACSCPADVMKTRLMSQSAGGGQTQYSGMVDCLRKSVAAEGWPVLWRGFFPTWARLGPWQLTFWLVYERMRAAAGMDGF